MTLLIASSGFEQTSTGAAAQLNAGFLLRVDLLGRDIVRVAVVPEEGLSVDRTWMVAPLGEVPWEGRDRLSVEDFTCPSAEVSGGRLTGGNLIVTLERDPLRLTIQQRVDGDLKTLFEDRPGGAYQWLQQRGQFKHFQRLHLAEAHYGLGDKTGPLDRTGRRLRCLQSDALGYNAETSDPLYKHVPFLIVSGGETSVGLLYDTMAETTFDLGAEHSNYFPRFRHVAMQEKGMVLYVLGGPAVRDIVPRLHDLTGRPAFPPRWSAGFAFTTMHHADSPDAQDVITGFAREARNRRLPISAIHLGSGYTAGNDGLRYVFNWNEERFPDRKRFFAELAELGFRTCANIKPVLLTGHGSFDRAADEGWFVRRADGTAAIEMFWGGQGASLDFSNPAALDFWSSGVREQVLGAGFDATWNDNNEAELWDEAAEIAGFGARLPAIQARPLHALLMTRASYQSTMKHNPGERPYTISRAGPIGIARYGETWSGDNRTSWHTLKWNIRQGLSMSLSGMPLVGHDVGGFDGPPPGPELLLRWFQMMALHPRCVMNSWKLDYDNIPNLPWMHEQVVDQVTAALQLRYRFLPLIYSLMRTAHVTGHPIIAPTFYHFDDPACREDADTFMLGSDVLVAPVVEQGAKQLAVYLPNCEAGWVDFYSGEHLVGGSWINHEAPLERLPLFIKSGAVLPLAENWPDITPHDADKVVLTAFCGPHSGTAQGEIFFDDGLTWGHQSGDASLLAWSLTWDHGEANIHIEEMMGGRHRPQIVVASVGAQLNSVTGDV